MLDFGLAKFLGSSDAETRATLETGDGVVLGTTAYMSPEQLKGQPPSPHWDLWALAIIVYEMLAGAYPFGNRTSIAALQNAILSGDVTPVTTHLPEAPAAWQAFVTASLDVDPAKRPRSAADFLTACERGLADGAANVV